MVKEKILADGHRDFTITIPNTYYGGDNSQEAGEVISNNDIQSFIAEMQQKFGVHFKGGDRTGKKAVLQFSTTQKEMQTNPLDEVYGKGAAKAASAYTMGEILTARREDLYQTMRKIACQMEKK